MPMWVTQPSVLLESVLHSSNVKCEDMREVLELVM